jgi:hypothetical protein
MSTGWVAGSVRAKAVSRRRLGVAEARALAATESLREALLALATTPYGHDVRADHTLAQAQHAVLATLLWHLRVLAGWSPREGADMLRLLAGAFEIANVDEHVGQLTGEPALSPYHLGSLATAWPRLARTTTLTELRGALQSSPWGDPGDASPRSIRMAMRLSWAARVITELPEAAPWAAGAAALIVARENQLVLRPLPESLARMAAQALGPTGVGARSLPDLANAIRRDARWAIEDIRDPKDLWRAEAGWWRRVESDGFMLLRTSRFSRGAVLGAVAVLAADAWRVRAALELAARGGAPLEVFDAVA